MKAWDIAKLVIERCDSSEEVGRAIAVLSNPEQTKQMCYLLEPFANNDPQVDQTDPPKKSREKPERQDPKLVNGGPNSDDPKIPSIGASSRAIASQLEPIFRKKGMTNKQVEEWVTGNFDIQLSVGKGSLSSYLVKVIDAASLGLKNRIFAEAQYLTNGAKSRSSDLKEYWDAFDAHFSDDE